MRRRIYFLILILLLTLDGFVIWNLNSRPHEGPRVSEEASYEALCVYATVFGTLCILFAERLGPQHGAFGHSYVYPVPPPVVAGFGWLLAALPPLVWALTS
jgi:hypothetical protein